MVVEFVRCDRMTEVRGDRGVIALDRAEEIWKREAINKAPFSRGLSR